MKQNFVIDEFAILEQVSDSVAKIRLLPFGTIVKGGVRRIIDRNFAEKFKLPHFSPPLKLGSHKEEAISGGKYVGLQVHEDGLYGLVELTENGMKAIKEKHYHYHSPEVIWESGSLEDPNTGESINGPIIVGDALLHTPHLGEAAALYSVWEKQGEEQMENGVVQVPASFLDRVFNLLGVGEQPQVEEGKNVDVEKLEAQLTEIRQKNDELQKTLDDMNAETKRADRIAHFSAEIGKGGDQEFAEILADLEGEVAQKIVSKFTALRAQQEQNIDSDVGDTGTDEGLDPKDRLNKAVLDYAKEKNVTYNVAFGAVIGENPDLLEGV